MKIFSVRKTFLEKNLAELGADVITFGFTKHDRQTKTTRRAWWKRLIEKISDIKPDIFWVMKDPHITPLMLHLIKKKSPKTKIVMWFGDQRGMIIPDLVKKRRGLLSGLFITNEHVPQIKMYRKFGIRHVHTFYHSFSTDEFQLYKRSLTHEVFFGGSNFSGTKFPLSNLRRQLIITVNNKFNLVVHGGKWPFATKKWILRNVYAKELRKAIVNLGINHYNITRYYNRRLFECVASGRLHLTYYVPGMEKHFKNKEHLVWFRSVDECIRQIKYYLKNYKERERIAKKGRDFFIKHHAWPKRSTQLINLFERML